MMSENLVQRTTETKGIKKPIVKSQTNQITITKEQLVQKKLPIVHEFDNVLNTVMVFMRYIEAFGQ